MPNNETTWVDWDLIEKNRQIFRFFQKMIAFRKAHPSLGRSRFWREDIHWYGTGGGADLSYESRSLAFCLHGASQNDQDIYVMINAWWREPDGGNLHVRFDEGSGSRALASLPLLLYRPPRARQPPHRATVSLLTVT